jgi:hypothetical protein
MQLKPTLFVLLGLAVLSSAAADYTYRHGFTLYYGDAEAHLNIARRIVDSRTPGLEQFGTVWLPLPHLLMLPFVLNDHWWQTGLAGVFPSAAGFLIAGIALFAAAHRAFDSYPAAIAALLVFATNPNLLYLQSTPMTEAVFLAGLLGLLWATLWFRDSQSLPAILIAAAASNAASLTRYEGWFLIPFVCAYLLVVSRRKWHAVLFAALAGLGPLAWLAHNQFYYSNALEFVNGPYSAAAIYKRQIAGGMAHYPGDHDWAKAAQYYAAAVRLTLGWPVIALGIAGLAVAALRRVWAILFLALVPLFYIWSMHSSGTPIFVPTLWPFSWYNTRYAIAALPLAAFACGALILLIPDRFRLGAATGMGVLVLASYFVGATGSICWKESQVNSEARRVWTKQAAQYLAQYHEPGSGIAFSFGDLAGVLREAGIPFRDALHDGNHPAWDVAMAKPEWLLREEWVLALSGDALATATLRADRQGVHYQLAKQIIVKGAPVVEIYHRKRP